MFKNPLIWIGLLLFGFFILKNQNPTAGELNQNLVKAQLAHNLALTETDSPNITPDNDKIPELANCPICKGTKIQVHADGHKTPCPYHGTTTEELLQKHMDLSELIAEMQQEDEAFKIQITNKLDEIDIAHKQPNPPVTKQAIPTNCPCGCRHDVANCNCRSTCPGKQLPAYTYVTVNKPILRKKIVCSGGSCYETYEITPQQQVTTTTQKQYNSPVMQRLGNWNQRRIKILPWRR